MIIMVICTKKRKFQYGYFYSFFVLQIEKEVDGWNFACPFIKGTDTNSMHSEEIYRITTTTTTILEKFERKPCSFCVNLIIVFLPSMEEMINVKPT